MSGALDDIVVLDVTRGFAASMTAAFLGDFGARVIRLGPVGGAAQPGAVDADGVRSGTWNHEADLIHRNKQSLALDAASARGRAVLEDIVARCDVILSDWPLAELAERGLDYGAASARRADIVVARISGFGPKGRDRDLPAIDELAAARTGMMPIVQQPGEPPVYTGAGAMHAAVLVAFGIVTALLHRQASGEGQQVDTSLFAGNMFGASLDLQAFLAIGSGDRLLNPISRLDVSNPMSGSLYASADGRWVTLTMPDTDRWWPDLAAITGLDAADSRFDTHDKRCELNRLELIHALEAAFARESADHWRAQFAAKRLSADIIERFDYPASDPQARANRYVIELEHPSFGRLQSLGFPIYMSESPARLASLAPCAGQHTLELLHGLLGYPVETIHELGAAGVVA
jgi:crotonobetainyl-CoA:carnitine CoA-transferase CaiB-like acyl-CoA transferase